MEAAETIMAADPSDAEAYKETVNNSVMSIFEACSFQDITGQRISKVIETLSVIEQRLNRLGEVWGSDGSSLPTEADQEAPAFDDDNPTMSGPALEGEGIDQEGVDALLSSEDTAEQAVETAMEFDDPEPVEPMSQDDMLTGEDIDDLLPSTEDTSYVSPAPVQQNIEYGTAEQLVRAVETLLQEDADDLASIEGEIEATERAERQEVGEASNDDFPPQRAPAKAAVGGGGKGKTTQADIDALFS